MSTTHRRTGRGFVYLAAALFGIASTVGDRSTIAHAAQTESSSSSSSLFSAALAKDRDVCPVGAFVRAIDESKTLYAISFRTIETGTASGTVTLYAGEHRYDVPFTDIATRGSNEKTWQAPPLVVHFPTPTSVDGAWVSALTGADARSCSVPYSPWSSRGSQDFAYLEKPSDATRAWQARMRSLTPVEAPSPTAEPVTCALPNQPPRTLAVAQPEYPHPAPVSFTTVWVLVLVDDQDAIMAATVEPSSGARSLDENALNTAMKSTFRSATFRCRKIVSVYRFAVSFSPT